MSESKSIWAIKVYQMHLPELGKVIVSMIRGDRQDAINEAKLQSSLLPSGQFNRKAYFAPATKEQIGAYTLVGNVIQ